MSHKPALMVALLVFAGATAGCLDFVPHARDTYVLTLTLVDLGNGTERTAGVGAHCGDAQWRGDKLHLERKALARESADGPLVVVEPHLDGPWATLGTEGWFRAAPADIDISIDGQQTTAAHIAVDGRAVRVDAEPVALPHAWSRTGDDGSWRLDLALREGPDRHHRFTRANCM